MADNTNPDADLEQAYSGITQSTAAQIKGNIQDAANTNPDQEAGYQHLAKFMQIPVQDVRANPDNVKAQAASSAVDAENMVSRSPHTANYLTDPSNVALSHDDIQNLLSTESSLRSFGAPAPSHLGAGSPLMAALNSDTAVGRVLGAGRDAYAAALDPQQNPPGFDSETYQGLTKTKIGEAITSPLTGAVGALDMATRPVFGIFSGIGGALRQTTKELGGSEGDADRTDRDWNALMASEMGRATGGHSIPHPTEPLEVAAARTAVNEQKAQAASTSAEQLQAIDQAAKSSQTRVRSSDAWNDFTKNAAQESPIKDVYIDGAALAQVAGPKMDALIKDVPAIGDQIHTAIATGSDVRIPVEDFASKIAGTELSQQLIPHLKTDPDGFSQVQAEEFNQTKAASLQDSTSLSLNKRLDNFVDERNARQEELGYRNEKGQLIIPHEVRNDPLLYALDVVASPTVLDTEKASGVLKWAMENGRDDIAQAILERADRSASTMNTEPGVDVTHPKYEGIKARLVELKKEATDEASRLNNLAKLQGEKRGRPLKQQTKTIPLQAEVEKVLNEKANDEAFQKSRSNVEESIMEQMRRVNRYPDQVNAPLARLFSNFYSVMGARSGLSPEEFAAKYSVKVASDNRPDGVLNQPTTPSTEPRPTVDDVLAQKQPLNPEAEAHAQKIGRLSNIEGELANLRNDPEAKDKVADLEREKALTEKWLDENSGVMYQDNAQKNDTHTLGSFNPQKLQINLLKGANLSTFLHESGHFFLHTMADVASRDDAPLGIKEDVQKIMDWFGVKDVHEWNSKTLEEQRPLHEKFARTFESYLMDGKAPSLEMQGIFNKFRAWLVSVYKTVVPGAAHIDPEVRGVFNRMLASSEDIKQAEAARGMEPLFQNAKEAGMTDEQFAQYKAHDLSGTEEATRDLQARRMRDMQFASNARDRAIRELQAEAKEKRQAVRDEVTKEVQKEPGYAAEQYIRRGETFDGEKALGNTKLSTEALRNMGYDEDTISAMGKGGKYGLTSADGVHPDAIAELFDMGSGKELVDHLNTNEPMREKIAGLTDQRMLERHGDLIDPQSVARAADRAIHNEVRAKVVATELSALNKQLGNKPLMREAAKNFAEQTVNRQKASGINPNMYMAAAAKAGRLSTEAFRKGDIKEAARQKQNQLINQYAVKAAYEAQRHVDGVLAQAKKLGNKAYREKIPGGYLEQIDKLLSRYDLRKGDAKEIARAQTNLTNWAESQREAGFEPALKDWLLDDPRDIKFKDMSVEEVKGLGDALKSMVYLAREMDKVNIAGEARALKAVVEEMKAPLIERGEKFTKDELLNPPEAGVDPFLKVAMYKMGSMLRSAIADLRPATFKPNMFDLHELAGSWGKYVFEPLFERNYWKVDRLKEVSDYFRDWGDKLGKDWQKSLYDKISNDRLVDPDLSERDKKTGKITTPVMMKMTRAKMLSMMSHVGNESNFDKLTRGYEWNPADVWKFIHDNATKQDWDAVQAQGKIFERFWPHIEDLAREMGGVPPDKIALRPVTTKFGTYEGWYAPIDYDPLRSRLSAKFGDIMADPHDQLGKEQPYRATTTTNGSMQNRSSGYTDRVLLDFHGFETRLRDTIHDLAYRSVLVNINKIITHPELRDQFLKTFGKEEFAAFQKELRDIRDMNIKDPNNTAFEKAMSYTRQGIVSTAIAYRLSTVLKHGSSAALKSAGYLGDAPGAKYFGARVIRMASGHAQEDIAAAREKFPEIRARMLQQDRDYKEGSRSMYEPEDWRAKNDRFGHALVAWSDTLSAVPTAWAAYDRAITEGVPVKQGGTGKPMAEGDAVRYANKIVREAHGSALETARSNFMNAKGAKKLFGVIYGFMNNTEGQFVDQIDKMGPASRYKDKPAAMAKLMGTLVVPAMLSQMISGTNKKDPWWEYGAKAIAGEVAGTVPFVRDAYSMFEYAKNDADTVGPLRIIQDVANSVRDAYHETQGKNTRIISDLSNSIGELFHIGGLGQAGKSLQYLRDVHTGKQSPQNALDVAKGVTIGPPPKQ